MSNKILIDTFDSISTAEILKLIQKHGDLLLVAGERDYGDYDAITSTIKIYKIIDQPEKEDK
jgi:hypothetical protein